MAGEKESLDLAQMERVATVAWTTSSNFGRDTHDLRRFRDWLVGLALCIQWSRSR